MQHVKLEDAESNLSALIEAAMDGEEVIITKDDDSVVKLTPVRSKRHHDRRFGSAKGLIKTPPDFDAPLEEFEPYMPAAREPRPFGLCAGEFTVPDDFDAPLPDEVLATFEN